MLYAVGMTFPSLTLNHLQETVLTEWLTQSGYTDAEDWARDSDYTEAADGVYWLDEHGNAVDPELQAWWAMEAAAEAGDEDAEAAVAKYEAASFD